MTQEEYESYSRQMLFDFYSDRKNLENASCEELTSYRNYLHDQFSSNKWKHLGKEDRIGALRALENDYAYRENRPSVPVENVQMKPGYFGGYDPVTNRIEINDSLIEFGKWYPEADESMDDVNIQMFDTIAHEGYHAYEFYVISNPEVEPDKGKVQEWMLNRGKNFQGDNTYYIQPLERDAWKFGFEQTCSAFEGIEERNGKEIFLDNYRYFCMMNSFEAAFQAEMQKNPQIIEDMKAEMKAGCIAKGLPYELPADNRLMENMQMQYSNPGQENISVQQNSLDLENGYDNDGMDLG